MKLYLVEYPFPIERLNFDGEDKTSVYYPSMREAIRDAKDHFQARDEYEDDLPADQQDIAPLSRKTAAIRGVTLELAKSFMCDTLNGKVPAWFDESDAGSLKYRQGKIVVMGAVEEKESEQ